MAMNHFDLGIKAKCLGVIGNRLGIIFFIPVICPTSVMMIQSHLLVFATNEAGKISVPLNQSCIIGYCIIVLMQFLVIESTIVTGGTIIGLKFQKAAIISYCLCVASIFHRQFAHVKIGAIKQGRCEIRI